MSIVQAVNLDGWSQESVSYAFDLLDKDLFWLGVLPADRDAGVSIENNINRNVKRQMNGLEIPPGTMVDINPLEDLVRAYMVLQDGSRHPLGVFAFSDDSNTRLDTGKGTRFLSMLDLSSLLEYEVHRVFSFHPARPVQDAISSLLNASPLSQYTIEPSSTLIGGEEGISWDVGTSYLTIVNDLCAMAGYYSLYIDNNGVGQVRKVPDLATAEPTLRYGSLQGEQTVFRGTPFETNDLLSAPNRYIVTNTSFTDSPIVGFWDIPSSAPHSIQNRNRVIAARKDMQGIESVAAANVAAKAFGESDYNTYQWATFDAAPNPFHDTFDIVSWEGVNYREQSWRLNCQAQGPHNHELRRTFTEVQV